jgi:AraC-like DNA-binding protein
MYVAYTHFPAGEFVLPPVNGDLVTVHLGRPVTSVRRRDGRLYQGTKVHGDIEMVPSGCPGSWVYESSDEAIGIIVAPELVQQVAAQTTRTSPERVEIRNNFCTRDPLIEKIGLALFADLGEDGVDGRLFAESAAHLLAVHLLRHYATYTYRVREYSGGLSRQKLRRVMELIHEHLEKDLKLGELAATAGVSPYHFARLFKQSTGHTPLFPQVVGRLDLGRAGGASIPFRPKLDADGHVKRAQMVKAHDRIQPMQIANLPTAAAALCPFKGAFDTDDPSTLPQPALAKHEHFLPVIAAAVLLVLEQLGVQVTVPHQEHVSALPISTATFDGDTTTADGTPGIWKTALTNSG